MFAPTVFKVDKLAIPTKRHLDSWTTKSINLDPINRKNCKDHKKVVTQTYFVVNNFAWGAKNCHITGQLKLYGTLRYKYRTIEQKNQKIRVNFSLALH